MATDDQFRKGVLEYYRRQRGSGFPVYRGEDLQYGKGLGDILRTIARFVLPIVVSGASKFITSTASGIGSGKNLKTAAKDAITPTIGDAVSSAGSQIMSRVNQSGRGRKRRSQRKGPKRIAFRRKMVYKGQNKSSRRKFRKSHAKKINFSPINF